MSLSNYTRNILNIKDENITFEENYLNCLNVIKINNKTIKTFHGKLTYTPTVYVLIMVVYMNQILILLLKK